MQQGPNFIESPSTTRRKLPPGRQGTLVLLCGREDFCSEARHELERRRKDLRIADADGLAGARQILVEASPAVILAEERALAEPGGQWRARRQAIESALSLLAGSAPVVWIGAAEEGAQLTQAVRSGAVDFVPRSALCLPAAVTMVERHLRRLATPETADGSIGGPVSLTELRLDDRDFGEVLRHELNNPLTGILGNAELLLLEARRGKLDLPQPALHRLEIIAELAVRMRETVRHLSDRWETTAAGDSESEVSGREPPPWPARGW